MTTEAAAPEAFAGPCWPDGVDGSECMPQFHRRLLADDAIGAGTRCRAIDVVIPPGIAEAPHTHPFPSFMLVDTPAAIAVTLVDANGAQREVFRRAEPSAGPAEESAVQRMDPEPLHFVANLQDDVALRAVRFEFLGKPAASPDAGSDSLLSSPLSSPTKAASFGRQPLMSVLAQCRCGCAGDSAEAPAVKLMHRWVLEDAVASVWRVDVAALPDRELLLEDLPLGSAVFVVEPAAVASTLHSLAVERRAGDNPKTLQPLRYAVADDATAAAESATPPLRPRVWAVGTPVCAAGAKVAVTTRPGAGAAACFIVEYLPTAATAERSS